MAHRRPEVIPNVADRENMHARPAKEASKLIKLTRRPALDELSNRLNPARPPLKKQESLKDLKPAVKPPEAKKLGNAPRSYSSQQLETVADVDADTKDEPQMVTEYVADIYSYLRELEAKYPINENFLVESNSTPRMRAILVNWLVQVHSNFGLCLETLHMCVSVVDRYLQNNPKLGRESLQMVGAAGLLVACKYEEIFVPDIDDFVYVCNEAFSKAQILRMEMAILNSLEFNLGKPLPIHFLRRYSKIGQVKADHHNLSKYILELALLDHSASEVRPSIQAAAACCLAQAVLRNAPCPSKVWTPTLVVYTTYKYSDFKPVVVQFAKLLQSASTSKHKSVQSKYAESKYDKISTHPRLKGELVTKLAAQATPKS